MQVVFKVKTPKGQATGTNEKIKKLIIGFNKVKVNTYVNEDDSEIFWECEGHIKHIMNIQRNLLRFDLMMKNVFEQKLMKRYASSNLKKEELEELEDMLRNQTTVELIKKATLDEVREYNETFFDKIKRTYKKFNPFSSNDSSNKESKKKRNK